MENTVNVFCLVNNLTLYIFTKMRKNITGNFHVHNKSRYM